MDGKAAWDAAVLASLQAEPQEKAKLVKEALTCSRRPLFNAGASTLDTRPFL